MDIEKLIYIIYIYMIDMIGLGWATLYTTIIEKYDICHNETISHEEKNNDKKQMK